MAALSMNADRWKRAEALFHAANALPIGERAAFLDEACDGDTALRREVASLLDEASATGVLDGPALVGPDVLSHLTDRAPFIGRTLGGYRLDALLGAGGMGEVYRGFDLKLGRDVAIKILPEAFTRDADRLARFEREARMLAALNHPNICAIYGLEEIDSTRFLILELVPGQTLAERIATSGALNVDQTVAIARQIADALEAAHEKGIIHRDLKPSNITITPDGVVKVLDFGLAKTIEVHKDGVVPAPTLSSSGAGAVLIGTAAYMSPEQARGLQADKRADIWGFGCVLYEMLTGRIAFGGATISDSIAKILEREPDWDALPSQTPDPLRRLLRRTLAKDAKKRLRDIGDARLELDAIIDTPAAATRDDGGRRIQIWWLAIAAAIVLALIAWPRTATVTPLSPLAGAQFTTITNWEGAEEGAEISKDGKFIAFLSDQEGEFDIWVTQVGSASISNLTRDVPALAGAGNIVRKLGFTGDGSELWFNPGDRKPLLLMPLTGGTSRVFLPESSNTPAWSNDGTRLVFFGKPPNGDDPPYLADRSGANARPIPIDSSGLDAMRGGWHKNNPVWSPDDRWIYFVGGSEPQNEINVDAWRIPVSGGAPRRLTNQHAAVNYPVLIDERTLLYVARDEEGFGPWLWSLDVETATTTRVVSGTDQYMSLSASRDGRRIAATIANPSSTIWRVPISSKPAADSDAVPYELPVPTGRASAPRFGGGSLFYLAARGTADGLWRVDAAGQGTQIWRDVQGALVEPPAISADGRLALVVRQQGRRTLWVTSENGSDRRTLAAGIDMQGAAGQSAVDWSPDGKWIVAGGEDARGPALFKIPVDGGEPTRLLDGSWVNPIWSPKDDVIVYAGRSVVGQVQLRAVRPDGTAVTLPSTMVRPGGYRFLPDGSGLILLREIHAQEFWRLDLGSGKSQLVVQLKNRGALRTFDVTRDGRSIVFDRSRQNSNVVLIELPQR
jgi:serine/threonine protein kinase/WD40 repeat protein